MTEIIPQLQAQLLGGNVANQPIAQANANELAKLRAHLLHSQAGLNERALELAGISGTGGGAAVPEAPAQPAPANQVPSSAAVPGGSPMAALPPPPQGKQAAGVTVPKLQLKGMGISGGNASMQFAPPTAKTMKVAPGTPNPATGKPYVTGDELPSTTPNQRVTAMVEERKPGQAEVTAARQTNSVLKVADDLQTQLTAPENADATAKLGPNYNVTLPGTGQTVGPSNYNILWQNYSQHGGKGNTETENKLMESFGFFHGTGFQQFLHGIRNPEIVQDIQVHIPAAWKDLNTNLENIRYLRDRYHDELSQIPASAGGEKGKAAGAPPANPGMGEPSAVQKALDFFKGYGG